MIWIGAEARATFKHFLVAVIASENQQVPSDFFIMIFEVIYLFENRVPNDRFVSRALVQHAN